MLHDAHGLSDDLIVWLSRYRAGSSDHGTPTRL